MKILCDKINFSLANQETDAGERAYSGIDFASVEPFSTASAMARASSDDSAQSKGGSLDTSSWMVDSSPSTARST